MLNPYARSRLLCSLYSISPWGLGAVCCVDHSVMNVEDFNTGRCHFPLIIYARETWWRSTLPTQLVIYDVLRRGEIRIYTCTPSCLEDAQKKMFLTQSDKWKSQIYPRDHSIRLGVSRVIMSPNIGSASPPQAERSRCLYQFMLLLKKVRFCGISILTSDFPSSRSTCPCSRLDRREPKACGCCR
jgi:hypothetical protein